MYQLIFLLLISFNLSLKFNQTDPSAENLIYGIYCGRGHYSNVGEKPIDIFDRVCQIHDICYTSSNYNCFCNEQIYYLISNLYAKTDEQNKIKDYILQFIFIALVGCKNHELFDNTFVIPKYSQQNIGFNFIPFYYDAPTEFSIKNKILLIKSDYIIYICPINSIDNINQNIYTNCNTYDKKLINGNLYPNGFLVVNPGKTTIKINIDVLNDKYINLLNYIDDLNNIINNLNSTINEKTNCY